MVDAHVARRAFLRSVSALGAACLLPGSMDSVRAGVRFGSLDLSRATLDAFTPHVGTTFRLEVEPGMVFDVKLAEAVSCKRDGLPAHVRQEPFSLVFVAPSGVELPQSNYELRHRELGDLSLFLVPVGSFPEGAHYEAVFA